ncbi:MAG: hypothetical protein OXT49_10910 [Gammaproteobacteria bacterium]|nr:hypothetical protein [Gammaproteobacteria bacterium]
MLARILLATAVLAVSNAAYAGSKMHYTGTKLPPKMEWSADYEIAVESRTFFEDAANPVQADSDYSFVLEAEFSHDFKSGNGRAVIAPFARWDSEDDERQHFDLREAYLNWYIGNWEVLAGVSKVFWGAVESAHLVDVINQTDQVESLDGEDKLGQPMVRVSWYTALGNFEAFVLPLFRERTFPGAEGRLRFEFGLPFDVDGAVYEDDDEDKHIDYAFRYTNSFAGFDVGIGHFDGTGRDPRFIPNGAAPTAVLPFYEQIEQTSIDVTGQLGGWLLKAEGYRRKNSVETYGAFAAGFEYTLVGVMDSAVDVGLLAEYLRDTRDSAGALFQDDVFVGSRIALNDVAGTEVLVGVVVDRENDSQLGLLEASRRLGDSGQLSLEFRQISGAPATSGGMPNPGAALNQDDHLVLEYRHFF